MFLQKKYCHLQLFLIKNLNIISSITTIHTGEEEGHSLQDLECESNAAPKLVIPSHIHWNLLLHVPLEFQTFILFISCLKLFLGKLWKRCHHLYEEAVQNKQEKALSYEQPNALQKAQLHTMMSGYLQKVRSILSSGKH